MDTYRKVCVASAFLVLLVLGAFFVLIPLHHAPFDYQYYVQSGDTFGSVATRFGVTITTLESENQIPPPYVLSAGETIMIPLNSTTVRYPVQPNDTIWKIAKEFETSWQNLVEKNDMQFPYIVYSGQKLAVPLSNSPISEKISIAQSVLSTVPMPIPGSLSSGTVSTEIASTFELANSSYVNSTTTSSQGNDSSALSNSTTSSSSSSNGGTSTISTVSTTSSSEKKSRNGWVWIFGTNPNAQLAAVEAHASNLSAASPMEFFLARNGSFSLTDSGGSQYRNLCPTLHDYSLGCYPLIQNDQTDCTGLMTLLGNFTLQQMFISFAIKYVGANDGQGINLDFEPSGGCGDAKTYSTFVTDLADGLHENSMSLSVDVASFDGGKLWNFTALGEGDVDEIMTMDTYNTPFNATGCNYTWAGSSFMCGFNKMYAEVPAGKIAIGLITQIDDADLSQRFEQIDLHSSPYVMVWPGSGDPISSLYWNSLGSYLGGKT